MLYVLIDANNFFIKNLFAYKSGMRKSEQLFEKEEQIIEYSHIISNSLFSLLEKFEGVVGFILCFDNKTWRKGYYSEYKAHREYDDAVNWDAYFRFVEDYCEKIQTIHNVKVSRIEGSEADDLLYLWSKKLNSSRYDCIVVSEDKDLLQLVNNTKSNNFTIVYNNNFKTPKIYKSPQTDLTESGLNINVFNVSEAFINSRMMIKSILNEVSSIEDIDIEDFILTKILIGDDGDNVPSVWSWNSSTNKKKRITPSIAQKIVKNFKIINEKPIYYLLNDFEFFKKALYDSIKFVLSIPIDEEALKENIERNCKLMCLHHKFFPSQLLKDFKDKYSLDSISKLDKEQFLKGTKYYQDPRMKVGKNDKLDSFFNAFGG
jgi:5'-3' exonuclease